MSLVSIIIPTYNRAHFLKETLLSIQAQTYPNWECIVVDDGSTDDTASLLTAFAKTETRLRYVKRPNNLPKGANSCRNYGFEIAKGDFINWFDSDDVMLPPFLEKRIELFQNTVDFVFCSGAYTDENLVIQRSIELIDSEHIFKDFVFWKLHLFTPSVLFKKSFLENKELFNPMIKRGQETDFFSRILFKVESWQYRSINEILFYYRHHDDSKSSHYVDYVVEIQDNVAYLYIENLKRGLLLKDEEITQHFWEQIVALWFRALSFGNTENMNYIKQKLIEVLHGNNTKVLAKMKIVFLFCSLVKKPSHKLRTYLKNAKLTMS